ncbi:MAG: ferritin-like domain-containing protein [Candidatus Acidiferrum sp.]
MKDPKEILDVTKQVVNRRSFVTKTGTLGLAAAAATMFATSPLHAGGGEDRDIDDRDNVSGDTAQQIFTAALIAEDLATTFYYNGLIGGVIQDPNLAGPGGTATHTSSTGNDGNVQYVRAALSEEISHADLLRSLIGGTSASNDPVQTFYFPTGSFDTLAPFTGLLDALENAFIGAYLNATIEFGQMSADTKARVQYQRDYAGRKYNSSTLSYFGQVAASILGIESEHRVLGRVISNSNPANQLCYEQTDGLTSVYNGPHSAVVALTPFLQPGSGKTAYSFQTALAGAAAVSLPCTGGIPAAPPQPKDDGR